MKNKNLNRWKLLGWSVLLAVFFMACSDSDTDSPQPDEPEVPELPADSVLVSGEKEYVSPGKYSLNVVYFIPADRDTITGWRQRLSGITLHIQEWYHTSMKYHGYDKTFNLLVNKADPREVKITHIQGEKNAADYDYTTLVNELAAYYRAHPEELASMHAMVIMPDGEPGIFNGGNTTLRPNNPVPDLFFALLSCDHADLSVENWEKYMKTVSLGGIMHELGHCFRLPHDCERVGSSFRSLMGDGNHYYTPLNRDNIKLTESDAMWLNQIQVFNTDEKEYYTELPSVTVEKLGITNDKENISVACSFSSPQRIVGFIACHDAWINENPRLDQSSQEWTDYDAITWCSTDLHEEKSAGGYKYQVAMELPWSAVPSGQKTRKTDRDYDGEIRIRFIYEDGLSMPLMGAGGFKGEWNSFYRTPYQIVGDGYPDLYIRQQDKKGWSIVSCSSEESTFYSAAKIIDGQKGFAWETAEGTTLPQHAVIDAGKEITLAGFRLEAGTYMGPERTIRARKVKIEGSLDNVNWETIVNDYTMDDNSKEIFDVACPKATARYFRLTLLEAYNRGDRASFQEFSIIPEL